MSDGDIEIDASRLPICEECDKVFSTHKGLASHMKSHSAGFICPECGKTVRYLVPHLRKYHRKHDDGLTSLEDGLRSLIVEVRELREERDQLKAQRDSHVCDS